MRAGALRGRAGLAEVRRGLALFALGLTLRLGLLYCFISFATSLRRRAIRFIRDGFIFISVMALIISMFDRDPL